MIGPGPGGKGAIWVALRVPDGHDLCHANKARIGDVPARRPGQLPLLARTSIDFAVEQGLVRPEVGPAVPLLRRLLPGRPRRSCATPTRACGAIFRRAAPSQTSRPTTTAACRAHSPIRCGSSPTASSRWPDVFALMRDHYEGTRFDMTAGHRRRAVRLPRRWRPLTLEDRRRGPTPGSGRSPPSRPASPRLAVAGLAARRGRRRVLVRPRRHLHLLLLPALLRHRRGAESFAGGSLREFSWDSAWWVFNLAANYAS